MKVDGRFLFQGRSVGAAGVMVISWRKEGKGKDKLTLIFFRYCFGNWK
jgi:hypothetical protein